MSNKSYQLKFVRVATAVKLYFVRSCSPWSSMVPTICITSTIVSPQVFEAATVKDTVCGPYLSYFVSLGN